MARRPLDGARRVTGDTATHARYKVGPASDYGADWGEVLRAPLKGSITRWWSGTGGNSVGITSIRWRVTIQHLSAYAGGTGTEGEGAVIGYVGNTGSATTGPHVHGFAIDRWTGKRYSIEEWLVRFFGFKNSAPAYGTVPGPYSTTLAGDIGTLIVEPPRRNNDMSKLYYDESTMVGGKIVKGTTRYALGGDGVGRAAWIDTTRYEIAAGWSEQIGAPAIPLSGSAFAAFEKHYLSPQPMVIDAAALAAALASLTLPAGGSVNLVLDAVTAIPAATVKLMPKTGTINLS